MKEKLIELLRQDPCPAEDPYLCPDNCKYNNGNDWENCFAARYADYLIANDLVLQQHGRWLGEGDGYADGELVYDVWYCSECNNCIDNGTDDPANLPKFCDECGAKMDGAVGSFTGLAAVNETDNHVGCNDVTVREKGEWVNPYINRYGHPCHCCSVCGFKASYQDKNFCPNCGADMRGAEHDA